MPDERAGHRADGNCAETLGGGVVSTAVKAARHARGWTHRYTVAQLREAARQVGEELPGDESVRHRLMTFEAGARPGPFYRDLLCTIYSATPTELGFPEPGHGSDLVRYHAGRRITWNPALDRDAVTALLYALPLDTTRIGQQALTRIRLYLNLVTTTTGCPERHVLGAGLRRARAHQPAWLDRDRLAVCERLAVELVGRQVPDPAGEVAPDWLTGARLTAAASTVALFTTHPPHTVERCGGIDERRSS